jgi:hypothetical protein
MEHGYTYTTIAARPGEQTRIGTSFYLDEDTLIDVVGTGGGQPFLSVEHGQVRVSVGPRVNDQLTDQDVQLVRRLAEQSARLLAEVERVHAEQQTHAAESAA